MLWISAPANPELIRQSTGELLGGPVEIQALQMDQEDLPPFLPLMSGTPTRDSIYRSKRPGLVRALSRTSALFSASQHDDLVVPTTLREAVHLDQQLDSGYFPAVVASSKPTAPPLTPNRIDLINKDHAGLVLALP